MKKLIIISLIVFTGINLFSYNKAIVFDYGFYNTATGNSFEDDSISMESGVYNPAMLAFNESKFQLSYIHKYKNPVIDTAGFLGLSSGFKDTGYSIYSLNSKFIDNNKNLYKDFNVGFSLSRKIGGIVSGIGVKYLKLTYNGDASKTENLQYLLGIKKSGKLSKNKLSIGLSFLSAVDLTWDNDFVYIKKIPAQIFFSMGLNRDNLYIFTRLNYIFPVTENLNSNYSYIKESDEIRISVGLMYDAYLFQFLDVKFLTGYQYIDNNTQIVGYGLSVSAAKWLDINFGGETGRLISNKNEYDKITTGVSIEL